MARIVTNKGFDENGGIYVHSREIVEFENRVGLVDENSGFEVFNIAEASCDDDVFHGIPQRRKLTLDEIRQKADMARQTVFKIGGLGDSVGSNQIHRIRLESILDSKNVNHEFVGHNDYNGTAAPYLTNAWGGTRFAEMFLGGTRTRNGITRFEPGISQGVADFGPDVLIFVGGHNDTQDPLADSEADFIALLDDLETLGIPVIIANLYQHDITAPNWTRPDSTAAMIPAMNVYIEREVAARPLFCLVDIHSAIQPGDVGLDGLHLSQQGQLKLGTMIGLKIKQYIYDC